MVIVGAEGERPHYSLYDVVLRSKTIRFKGVRYWYFESAYIHHLIDPDDIQSIEELRKRYQI